MNDYLLLVKGENREASPEQMQQILTRYQSWMKKWKDEQKYIDGSPLKLEGVHLMPNGRHERNGGFLSSDEVISGFIWIRADSVDEAQEIASGCPLLDNLEIYLRPFLSMK